MEPALKAILTSTLETNREITPGWLHWGHECKVFSSLQRQQLLVLANVHQ